MFGATLDVAAAAVQADSDGTLISLDNLGDDEISVLG
jgi:hypothetical protein